MVKNIKRKKQKEKKYNKWMLMASYPLAIETVFPQPFQIDLSAKLPKAVIRSVRSETKDQIMKGESYISIEYETPKTDSIIQAVNEGMGIVEDIIALFALSSGIPALECAPIQILHIDHLASVRPFAFFLDWHHLKWDRSLSASELYNVQKAFMHWRGLENGHRIRRAMKRYGEALARVELIDAFQIAFMGLEALEKPLADELGIEPGVEIVKGKCASCGTEFERRKTALNAVKQYVYGKLHAESKDRAEQGKKEWKAITDLRNALFHAYKDPEALAKDAHDILPAVFHYLHDASAHLGHLHELESIKFAVPRKKMAYLIYIGDIELMKEPSIATWQPMLDADLVEWRETEGVMTPSFKVASKWLSDGTAKSIGGHFYFLNKDIAVAQETDLKPARYLEK